MAKVKTVAVVDESDRGYRIINESDFDEDKHERYEETDAVSFASSAAEELAESEGLDASDFEGREASSDNGYTKADVEDVVGG